MFRPHELRRSGSDGRPSGADLRAVFAIAIMLVAVFAVVTIATDSSTTSGTEGTGSTIYVSSDGNDSADGTQSTPYATLAFAYSKADSGATICLLSDITLSGELKLEADKTITLTSNSGHRYSITRGSGCTGTLLNVTNGSVTLTNVTIDGGKSGSDFLVKVGDGSNNPSLTLGDGATVQNGTGGGILLGVGKELSGKGKLTIQDGAKVTGNSNGKVWISDTESTTVGGIQIFGGNTTFVMNGGEISGNSANWAGGINVVYNSSGSAQINGGTIKNNTAGGGAGGILVDQSGKIVLNGGTIAANRSTSSDYGGLAVWNNTSGTSGTIYIGGGVGTPLKITGNVNHNGVATDIYLISSSKVIQREASKVLASGSSIGIRSGSSSSSVRVVASSTADEVSYFYSDSASAEILSQTDGIYLSGITGSDQITVKVILPSGLELASGSGTLEQSLKQEDSTYKFVPIKMRITDTTNTFFTNDGLTAWNTYLNDHNLDAVISDGVLTIDLKTGCEANSVVSFDMESDDDRPTVSLTVTEYRVYKGNSLVGQTGDSNKMDAVYNASTGRLTWRSADAGTVIALYNGDVLVTHYKPTDSSEGKTTFDRFYCVPYSGTENSSSGTTVSSIGGGSERGGSSGEYDVLFDGYGGSVDRYPRLAQWLLGRR